MHIFQNINKCIQIIIYFKENYFMIKRFLNQILTKSIILLSIILLIGCGSGSSDSTNSSIISDSSTIVDSISEDNGDSISEDNVDSISEDNVDSISEDNVDSIGSSSVNSYISGYVVANNVHDAIVTGRDKEGEILGTVNTDKNGKYVLNIGDYRGIVLLDVIGGNYIDEYTNNSTMLSINMRAASIVESNNNTINITPLTEIAFRKINNINFESQTIKNINQSLSDIVSDINNPVDIIKTIPSTITNTSSANEQSKYYGLLLASFSANGNLNTTLSEIDNMIKMEKNSMIDDGLDELISKNLTKLTNLVKDKGLLQNIKNLFNKEAIITPNFEEITNLENVSLLISGKGLVSYKYKLDNQSYSEAYKINEIIKLSNLLEGRHSLSVIVKSTKGHWTKEKNSTIFNWENDYTAPTVSIDKPTAVYDGPIEINLKIQENDTLYYTLDGTDPFPGTRNTFKVNKSAKIFIYDSTLVTYYSQDKAGNISEVNTLKYDLPDKFAPTVKLIEPLHNSVSYNTQPTIELELKDESGLDYSTLKLFVDQIDITHKTSISNNKLYYTPDIPLSDKKIDISLEIKDNSGNKVNKYYSFIVDSSELKIDYSDDNGFYFNPFYLRLSTNRPSKIYYTLDNTAPLKNESNTLLSYSPFETLKIYENTIVKYFAEDNFGNITDTKTLEFFFDKESPFILESSIKHDGYINTLKPIFDINFSDSLSGIDTSKIEFKVNGFSKIKTATVTNENLKYIPQFDLNEDINTMELFLVDNVGNNRYFLYNYRLDVTKPISFSTHQSTIYNKDIIITISSNEKGNIYYTLDGTTPTITNKQSLPLFFNLDKTTNLKYIIEDLAKNQEELKEYTFTIDKTKPDTPENLIGRYKDQEVELSWDSILQSDFASYNIYRSMDNSSFNKIASLTQNSYVDTNTTQSLINYQVTSVDLSGNESGFSNIVSGVVQNAPPIITLDTNETIFTNQNQFNLSGAVQDNSIITSVTVNGANVNSSNNYATWSFQALLNEGKNSLVFKTIDEYNNIATQELFIIKDSISSTTVANIPSGIYNSIQNVSFVSNESDAKIYYTMDGSEPTTTNGILYTNEIENITTDTIIKYRSIDKLNNIEPVQTLNLIFAFLKPELSSSFKDGEVFLTPNINIQIKYKAFNNAIEISKIKVFLDTVDITNQIHFSKNDFSYDMPSILDGIHTLKIYLEDEASNNSTTELSFVLNSVSPVTTLTPKEGFYNQSQNIQISLNKTGTIYYTINQQQPILGTAYTFESSNKSDLSIDKDTTITYFAIDSYGRKETTKTATYVFESIPPSLSIIQPINNLITNNSNLTIDIKYIDNNSEIDLEKSKFSIDGVEQNSYLTNTRLTYTSVFTEGIHEFILILFDKAGNFIEHKQKFEIDTISPILPEIVPSVPIETRDDLVSITIKGKIGSEVYLNGDATNIYLLDSGVNTISVDTSGELGLKIFTISLKDQAGNFSDEYNLSIERLTSLPILENILSNIDNNGTVTEVLYKQVVENQFFAIDINASNQNDLQLTYSLENSLDSEFFAIDSDSGIVSFIEAPDFETPKGSGENRYIFNVKVSNITGGVSTQLAYIDVVNDEDISLNPFSNQTTTIDQSLGIALSSITNFSGNVTYEIKNSNEQLFKVYIDGTTLKILPKANTNGTVTIEVTASIAGFSDTKSFQVQNIYIPRITVDTDISGSVNQSINTHFSYIPSNNSILSTSISNQPSNGTVSVNNQNILYTPNENFIGKDSFTLTFDDTNGGTIIKKFTVNIYKLPYIVEPWHTVGIEGFSRGAVSYLSLAIDNNNIPYTSYQDYGNSNKITVKKFNGSSWETVGIEGVFPSSVYDPSLAIDNNNIPYVSYRDKENPYKITVKKFNGSSWETVGTEEFSSSSDSFPSLAIDNNNIPYVFYRDKENSGKVTVKKFNDSSWETVGVEGFSSSTVYYPSIAIDNNNIPYTSYQDYGKSAKITVKKFNGSSWETVGVEGFSSNTASYPSLAIDNNNIPYTSYQDGGKSNKITVKKFNGSSWETVGVEGLSSNFASYPSLAIDNNNIPYTSYQDHGNSNKITVKKFNGSSWETVGIEGFSSSSASYNSLAIDNNNIPYVSYRDNGKSAKITVKKFNNSVIMENKLKVIDIEAIDPNEFILTYSLLNSFDSSLFTIDSNSGELWFKEIPTYDNPLDADKNNKYELEIKVTNDKGGYITKKYTFAIKNVDEVNTPPFRPSIKNDTLYTNNNTKSIEVYGERGTEVLVDSINIYSEIPQSSKVNILLSMDGVDGIKLFQISLKDSEGNISDNTIITVIKDTIQPDIPTIQNIPIRTNRSNVIIDVYGEIGTSILVNGISANITISDTGKASIPLETKGSGTKKFFIQLQDKASNISDSVEFLIFKEGIGPLNPIIKNAPAFTNEDEVEVEVYGEIGTTILVNNISTELIIDSNGYRKIILDTSGGINGERRYKIALRDTTFNESGDVIISIIKDTQDIRTIVTHQSGNYKSNIDINCLFKSGAILYYTIDGSTPTLENSLNTNNALQLSISKNTTLKFFAVDLKGTTESIQTYDYIIDKIAPSIVVNSPVKTLFNTREREIIYSYEDENSGLDLTNTIFKIDGIPSNYLLKKAGINHTKIFEDGIHSIYLKLYDKASNYTEKSFSFTIDTISPEIIINTNSGIFNSAQTINLSTEEDATIYYTVDGTEPLKETALSSKGSLSLDITKTTTLKYFAIDLAENSSDIIIENYIIDKIAPSIVINSPVKTLLNTKEREIIYSYEDENSGLDLTNTIFKIDGILSNSLLKEAGINHTQIFEDGIHSIYLKLYDKASNYTEKSFSFTIDTISPEIIINTSSRIFNNTQIINLSTEEDATIYYTVDGTEPLKETALSSKGSLSLDITKTTTLKYFAIDLAGNSSDIVINNFIIDTVAPILISGLNDSINNISKTDKENIFYTFGDATEISTIKVYNVADNKEYTNYIVEDNILQIFFTDTKNKEYLLKIEVIDEVGNTLEIEVAFNVDIISPYTTPSLKSGKYYNPISVNLISNEKSIIYYSLDGYPPMKDASNTFTVDTRIDGLEVNSTTNLQFFSVDLAGNKEDLKSEVYLFDETNEYTSTLNAEYNENQTSVHLSWDNIDTNKEYKIFRTNNRIEKNILEHSQRNGYLASSKTILTTSDTNSFIDNTVEIGSKYYYGVSSLSTNGIETLLSNIVEVDITSSSKIVEITDSISRAKNWLLGKQKDNGSWDKEEGLEILSTSEVLNALEDYQSENKFTYNKATTYLYSKYTNNNDFLARKIITLGKYGFSVEGLINRLISQGKISSTYIYGWGLDKFYETDVLGTILGSNALEQSKTNLAKYNGSFYALKNYSRLKSRDGYWGWQGQGETSLYLTSFVYNTVKKKYSVDFGWIIGTQKSDGSFGLSLLDTIGVVLYLDLDESIRKKAKEYIISLQNNNGNWDDDPYITALALQALKKDNK